MREEAAKKRRQKQFNLRSKNQKKQQDLKTKKLSRSLYIRDSRGRVKKKKTGLSNIPAAEGMATVNRKARGLSNLPSDYKKQEQKFSKKAAKSTPTKNDKKTTSKKESGTKTPSGYVRNKGRLYSVRTAQGKKLQNKLKARKRAQEMYKKNKANK